MLALRSIASGFGATLTVLALGSCVAQGDAGPFQGVYMGQITTTTMVDPPNQAMIMTQRSALAWIEASRAPGVDFTLRLEDIDCLFDFTRTGDTATLADSTPCEVGMRTQVDTPAAGDAGPTETVTAIDTRFTMLRGMASLGSDGSKTSVTVNLSWANAITSLDQGQGGMTTQTVMLTFKGDQH
jgi:hypothetical protein